MQTNLTNPAVEEQVLPQRFWEKVDLSGECWEWKAARYPNGYGVFGFGRKNFYAHRVSYSAHHGDIPTGMQVDHTCYNRACVNPAHLRLSTVSQNQQNRSGLNSNNTSGVRGVSWAKDSNKWVARGRRNGKKVHIGLYVTLEEAEAAAVAWRREHMPYSIRDLQPSR